MERTQLAIIIPAYCEATSISDVVNAVKAYGSVIVVDDCSNDATAELAEAAGAIVVHHTENKGYDHALNTGFEKAAHLGFNAVVTMDADGEHAVEHLAEFQQLLLNEDIPLVIGIRPKKQRVAEVLMGAWVNRTLGVKDILCGMKGYHMRLWREHGCFDATNSIGTELAVSAIAAGYPFAQVYIDGTRRQGIPRFGGALKGNATIIAALCRALSTSRQTPDDR